MRNMQKLVFWTDFYGDKTCRLPCFWRDVLYIHCEKQCFGRISCIYVFQGFEEIRGLESIWNSLTWEAPRRGTIWNSLAWEAPTGGKVKKTPLGGIWAECFLDQGGMWAKCCLERVFLKGVWMPDHWHENTPKTSDFYDDKTCRLPCFWWEILYTHCEKQCFGRISCIYVWVGQRHWTMENFKKTL